MLVTPDAQSLSGILWNVNSAAFFRVRRAILVGDRGDNYAN